MILIPNNEDFIRLIKERMDVYGMSGRELGRRMQLGSSTVSNWLTGKYSPTTAQTLQMVEILGMEMAFYVKDKRNY